MRAPSTARHDPAAAGAPLYGGHSAQELLAVLQGNTQPDDYTIWCASTGSSGRNRRGAAISSAFWHEALRPGIVTDSAAPALPVTPRKSRCCCRRSAAAGAGRARRSDCCSGPTRRLGRPLRRQCLAAGDAAPVHPADLGQCGADRAGNGRPARPRDARMSSEIACRRHDSVRAPVFVLPGQAADCITLPLGFGRRAGGLGVGCRLRRLSAARRRRRRGSAQATSFSKTGEHVRARRRRKAMTASPGAT